MGDSIATNLFMLGFAYQRGLMPLSRGGDRAAIELNGVAVEANKESFAWGRRAAADPDAVRRRGAGRRRRCRSRSACPRVARRGRSRAAPTYLTDYQDAAYAQRYADLVARVRAAEAAGCPGEHRARRGGRALLLQAAGEQGRVRGRAAVRRERLRAARRRAVRGRLHAALPPRAAAPRQARSRRPASRRKRSLRPVDAEGVRACSRECGSYRGTLLDVFGRSAERKTRARADRRVRGAGRRDPRGPRAAQPRARRRARAASRTASAATATSRRATSTRPRRRKRNSSPGSARRGRRRRPRACASRSSPPTDSAADAALP